MRSKENKIIAAILAVPIFLVMYGMNVGGVDYNDLSQQKWPSEAVQLDDQSEAEDEGGNAGSSGIVHGDTSVPDDKLLKQYGDKVPDEVYLYEQCQKMSPVLFPHQKHEDMKIARCGNCHHENPKDIKKCWDCHNAAPEDEKAPKYMKAYHGLCHPCHKARKKGKEGPPVKCKECHKKENTAATGSECPVPKKKESK